MMKRVSVVIAVFACMAFPLVCRAANQPQDTAAKIDQYMQAVAKYDHFMGAVLVARGDHIIFAKGYGKANIKQGIANTPDTQFRIGSVTKQFTAMAILMLQTQGKLKVSDPVCKYVSDCPKDWQPITIANLLTHTSGIPDYLNTLTPAGMLKIFAQSNTASALLARFKNQPLDFKPGAKFSYSNSGYVLLAYIIERVSGEPWGQFLQQHIFEPLHMTHSGYGKHDVKGKVVAQGYVYAGKYRPGPILNPTNSVGDGGIHASVRDLYTWDRALDANTGKLIPPSLHKKMFTPHVRVKGELAKIQAVKGAEYYGYGWFIRHEFGHLEYSHEGGIPGFTSFNSWFPKQHVYIIVLDNMTSPGIFRIGKTLAAIMFGKPYTVPQPFKAISLPAKALAKFVGMYQMAPNRFMTITRDGDQLKAQLASQNAFKIYPESATRFFYKVVRAQIFFQTNAQGEVTGLVLHQNSMKLPGKRLSAAEAKAIKAKQAANAPKAIQLPASALQKFVGTYQLAPGYTITVTRDGDQLSAQMTGQPALKIYPESKTEFFPKGIDAKITFQTDPAGKVTQLVLHQDGRSMPAKKVK